MSFLRICAEINSRPDLVSDLTAYRERWIEVDESDDQLAFAGLPRCMSDVDEIVKRVSGDVEARHLTLKVIGRYLSIF